MGEIGRAEAAAALLVAQQDRAPWFWKPSWYWFGWKTLLPVQVGHDEYCRRTIVLGWSVTGRVIFPLWDCGGAECREDAIRGIQDGDVWWEDITKSLRAAHPGGETAPRRPCVCLPAIAGISDGPSVDCPTHGTTTPGAF